MAESFKSTPRNIEALGHRAGLEIDARRARELAKLWPGFQIRVDRLYDVDVSGFEFDFLHPMSHKAK